MVSDVSNKEYRIKKREIESTRQELRFLAMASKKLASSLDYETTLTSISKLIVPHIADWCVVQVLDEKNQNILRLRTVFKDPHKAKVSEEFEQNYSSLPVDKHSQNFLKVLKTGKPVLVSKVTADWYKQASRDKNRLKVMKKLNPTSHLLIPLKVNPKKVIGVLSLARLDHSPSFNKTDLILAEGVAQSAAIALENAKLYQDSQAAVALRDDFISVASHELKTPLTSVKIFTEVLLKNCVQNGDQKSAGHLSKMNKQLDKLNELIFDMLNISKIQAGRLEFNHKLFSFDNVIDDIVDVLQQGANKHQIIIKGKTNKNIYGDEDRVGQVVSNLVSNAIKYSPRANKVIIHLSGDKDNVYLCVEDFGIGIDKDHTKHIFERFYRVFDETDKTFPGLGIGLYISNEIIRRHNGKMWVDSKLGKGSKFSFSLPLTSL